MAVFWVLNKSQSSTSHSPALKGYHIKVGGRKAEVGFKHIDVSSTGSVGSMPMTSRNRDAVQGDWGDNKNWMNGWQAKLPDEAACPGVRA